MSMRSALTHTADDAPSIQQRPVLIFADFNYLDAAGRLGVASALRERPTVSPGSRRPAWG
ncbi:MAG: hypothetical protein Q9Q13_14600 [Acidobacteriota bacterium]|nr:hypothetical protein [Acidobacteriota bacterium]